MAQRFRIELVVMVLLLGVTSASFAADQHAVISGVVRDGAGVPQVGAVVQIVSTDAIVRATAFTDIHGRYTISRVLPGLYGVHATAALFLPAARNNLRIQPNHRSIVNLTLSGLLDEFAWLPARAKAADEARDDWNWTLRSSASRPMLKVADDGITEQVATTVEGPRTGRYVSSRAVITTGTERFGDGAARVGMRSARTSQDGSIFAVSSSAGGVRTPSGMARPMSVATIVERRMGPGALLASRVQYQEHPEIPASFDGAALRLLTVSSAEKFDLGDMAQIEAGSRLQAIAGGPTAVVTRPFLRVSAHPGPGLAVTYHLATARAGDDYESAIWQERTPPPVAAVHGRIGFEKGIHQEVTISHRTRATMLSLAYYGDTLDRVALTGGGGDRGLLGFTGTEGTAIPSDLLVDRGNGSFQTLVDGYRNAGFNVECTRAVGGGTWVTLQYATGSGLAVDTTQPRKADSELPVLRARKAQSAAVSVKTSVARTGTKLRATYRWQPAVLVTSIDPYDVPAGGDYLSVRVREPLRLSGLLPDGMELTVDGVNLLAQGQQPFVDRNGRPLYLVSTSRSLQAGLAFNF